MKQQNRSDKGVPDLLVNNLRDPQPRGISRCSGETRTVPRSRGRVGRVQRRCHRGRGRYTRRPRRQASDDISKDGSGAAATERGGEPSLRSNGGVGSGDPRSGYPGGPSARHSGEPHRDRDLWPRGNTAPETTLLSGYGVDTLRWVDNVRGTGARPLRWLPR